MIFGGHMEECILVKPDKRYADKILAFRKEFAESGSMDGCGALKHTDDPYEFIRRCELENNPNTVPEGRVQATLFLMLREKDEKILGLIQIRHYLNDYLEKYGGHIGYSVCPSERRKGYAKTMLRAVLPFCRELGIEKALLTCNADNIGSERTIMSCGGKFESEIYEPLEGKSLKRFWISL